MLSPTRFAVRLLTAVPFAGVVLVGDEAALRELGDPGEDPFTLADPAAQAAALADAIVPGPAPDSPPGDLLAAAGRALAAAPRRPSVLLVGLAYAPLKPASDKTFMRDVVQAVAAAGRLRPIVLSVTSCAQVVAQRCGASGEDCLVPIFMRPRAMHPAEPPCDRPSALGRADRRHPPAREYLERSLTCLRIWRFARWAKRRYGVRHVHFFDNLGPLMAPAVARAGLTCGATMHASTGDASSRSRPSLWRASLRHVDSVVAGSDDMGALLESCGVHVDTVIPWGPSPRPGLELPPATERDLVVWAGPVQGMRERELELAAQAMRAAADAVDGMRLEVWPKPSAVRYLEIAKRHGIPGTVHEDAFLDELPRIRVLVSPTPSPDVVVAPPLTWLEAIQAGAIVVTTPCRGIPRELLEAGRMVVASGRTPTDLRDAIVRAWEGEPRDGDHRWTSQDAALRYEELWAGYTLWRTTPTVTVE